MVQLFAPGVNLRSGEETGTLGAGGDRMAHDALAMVVYRHNPPACLFGDSGEALERMRRTAEAAGCRIAGSVAIGADLAPGCVPTASASTELNGAADEAVIVPLLDWAQHEAASGARRIVVSAPRALIDLIWAQAPHRHVAHLCGTTEADRIAAVAFAGR